MAPAAVVGQGSQWAKGAWQKVSAKGVRFILAKGVRFIFGNRLNAVAGRLKERPRKTLGYYLPAEKQVSAFRQSTFSRHRKDRDWPRIFAPDCQSLQGRLLLSRHAKAQQIRASSVIGLRRFGPDSFEFSYCRGRRLFI